jgi:curved DNA-binding protein CbpA
VRDRTGTGGGGRDAYEVLEVRPDASQVVINAAFRALAAVHHPDASGGSSRRMAELNAAYAQLRTNDLREAYDKLRGRGTARVQMTPSPGAQASRPAEPGQPHAAAPKKKGVLDFGRYEGWSVADLARRDPDYLRWLRRHSSGIRFRNEIDAVLANLEPAAKPQPESRRR